MKRVLTNNKPLQNFNPRFKKITSIKDKLLAMGECNAN
jgi:hypothetical protein